MDVAQANGGAGQGDFSIKPEISAAAIPTSDWPLLLKDYDKRGPGLFLLPLEAVTDFMQCSSAPATSPQSREDARR
jgi:hypothetical protein